VCSVWTGAIAAHFKRKLAQIPNRLGRVLRGAMLCFLVLAVATGVELATRR
jgi:hypothetical protein